MMVGRGTILNGCRTGEASSRPDATNRLGFGKSRSRYRPYSAVGDLFLPLFGLFSPQTPRNRTSTCRSAASTTQNASSVCRNGSSTCQNALSTARTGLSTARTGLSTARTGLSLSRIGLSSTQTAISTCRTGSSTARNGVSSLTTGHPERSSDGFDLSSGLSEPTTWHYFCRTCHFGVRQSSAAFGHAKVIKQRQRTGALQNLAASRCGLMRRKRTLLGKPISPLTRTRKWSGRDRAQRAQSQPSGRSTGRGGIVRGLSPCQLGFSVCFAPFRG